MLVSPSLIALPSFYVMRPRWNKMVLTNTEKTDIVWFNPADHTQPYPWRFSVTSGNPAANYSDINTFSELNSYNLIPYEYTFLSAPSTNGASYSLMMVDAAGADLFDLQIPSRTRPEHANGIYLKQIVVGGTLSVNIARYFIIWEFRDDVGNIIPPPF